MNCIWQNHCYSQKILMKYSLTSKWDLLYMNYLKSIWNDRDYLKGKIMKEKEQKAVLAVEFIRQELKGIVKFEKINV